MQVMTSVLSALNKGRKTESGIVSGIMSASITN